MPMPSSSAHPTSTDTTMDGGGSHYFYRAQIRAMQEYKTTTLFVDYTHLMNANTGLTSAITDQYYRYVSHLSWTITVD
jgi:DNA replication licensing factor MCM6